MTTKPTFDGGSIADIAQASEQTVKAVLVEARNIPSFLREDGDLTRAEKMLVVEQAIALLEGFYVHMPLKRAMHAVDPLQRLRLLTRRLDQLPSSLAFHNEMTEIFTSLRDLHTNYVLPSRFASAVAFLPFRVEACHEAGQRKYIVSSISNGLNHPTFVRGVEIVYWNGIPIERAVEIAASYHAGSNPPARHARGVAGLTKRALSLTLPPDEEWVIIGYKTLAGETSEFRIDWVISELPAEASGSAPDVSGEAATELGLDLEGDTFRRIDEMLFAQHVIAATQAIENVRSEAMMEATERGDSGAEAVNAATRTAVQGTDSILPKAFTARPVQVDGKTYAYIRIWTFNADVDSARFVNEFLRLIELPEMPKDGLILDVRSNGGGIISAGERLLQLLTPRTIEPCRVQFINTPATLQLCRATPSLTKWVPSLERAVESGAVYSAAHPITRPDLCNDLGQHYYGPVVVITDARCYSTTDIFAAGFQDHAIGKVLGADANTGAGGANVWTDELIRQFFADAHLTPPLQELPRGARMRVAIRRTLRVGAEAGTELEDFGVRPDEQHQITQNDVLNGNLDLIAHAARMLAAMPARRFDMAREAGQDALHIRLATLGVDRVDAYLDSHPVVSTQVVDNAVSISIQNAPAGTRIELRGYEGPTMVCKRCLVA